MKVSRSKLQMMTIFKMVITKQLLWRVDHYCKKMLNRRTKL